MLINNTLGTKLPMWSIMYNSNFGEGLIASWQFIHFFTLSFIYELMLCSLGIWLAVGLQVKNLFAPRQASWFQNLVACMRSRRILLRFGTLAGLEFNSLHPAHLLCIIWLLSLIYKNTVEMLCLDVCSFTECEVFQR